MTFKKVAATTGPFLLAILLLYLAFRGTSAEELLDVLRRANYLWLFPLAIVTVFSHWLRAWRWAIFLEAVPETPPRSEQRVVSTHVAFGSLMIGYMVNYATARIGEVVRAAIVSRKEKMSFSSVAGTVVLDRLVDIITLGLALLSVLFILRGQMTLVQSTLLDPAIEQISSLPGWVWVVTAILLIGAAVAGLRMLSSGSSRLRRIADDFRTGLMTLFRTRRPAAIIIATVAMWTCYICMAFLPFLVLGYHENYPISIMMAWVVMNIGALGVVVPAPGGIGSYHYIAILALTALYSVSQTDAAAYAFLTHGAQLVLYTLLGFAYVLYFGLGWKLTQVVEDETDPPDDSTDDAH